MFGDSPHSSKPQVAPHSVLEDPVAMAPVVGDRAVGNFSAGPAALTDWVMHKAADEFANYNNTGMGIMEMSHRDAGGPVQNCIWAATENIRRILSVPSNFHIIFVQGGAHGQFAAVPLNLLGDKTQADYVSTGFWSLRAKNEANKYCNARYAYDGAKDNYQVIPPVSEWDISPHSAYVHICANETIHGLEFLEDPELPEGSPPLVGDFTSTLPSRRINFKNYGCIYASGGKNLGPAGVTLVIVRDDLIRKESPRCPAILSYAQMVNTKPIPSIYNTPPTFLIYMVDLVLQDNFNHGGIEYLEKRAIQRSRRVYDVIDNSGGFYQLKCKDRDHMSRMNIPFRIRGGDKQLEGAFTEDAENRGLLQLFCHPLFPGCRITLYNGVPDSAVDALTVYMEEFRSKHA